MPTFEDVARIIAGANAPLSEFSIQTGSSARKRRFSFVSRDGKGAEIGTASSVLLATELADEGVEGWREEKAKAGYAQHSEQHRCAQRLPHLRACSGRNGEWGNAQNE